MTNKAKLVASAAGTVAGGAVTALFNQRLIEGTGVKYGPFVGVALVAASLIYALVSLPVAAWTVRLWKHITGWFKGCFWVGRLHHKVDELTKKVGELEHA